MSGLAPSPDGEWAAPPAFRAGDLPEAERVCNGAGQPFSAAGLATARRLGLEPDFARLCIANQNGRPAPSSAALRPASHDGNIAEHRRRVQPRSASGG